MPSILVEGRLREFIYSIRNRPKSVLYLFFEEDKNFMAHLEQYESIADELADENIGFYKIDGINFDPGAVGIKDSQKVPAVFLFQRNHIFNYIDYNDLDFRGRGFLFNMISNLKNIDFMVSVTLPEQFHMGEENLIKISVDAFEDMVSEVCMEAHIETADGRKITKTPRTCNRIQRSGYPWDTMIALYDSLQQSGNKICNVTFSYVCNDHIKECVGKIHFTVCRDVSESLHIGNIVTNITDAGVGEVKGPDFRNVFTSHTETKESTTRIMYLTCVKSLEIRQKKKVRIKYLDREGNELRCDNEKTDVFRIGRYDRGQDGFSGPKKIYRNHMVILDYNNKELSKYISRNHIEIDLQKNMLKNLSRSLMVNGNSSIGQDRTIDLQNIKSICLHSDSDDIFKLNIEFNGQGFVIENSDGLFIPKFHNSEEKPVDFHKCIVEYE